MISWERFQEIIRADCEGLSEARRAHIALNAVLPYIIEARASGVSLEGAVGEKKAIAAELVGLDKKYVHGMSKLAADPALYQRVLEGELSLYAADAELRRQRPELNTERIRMRIEIVRRMVAEGHRSEQIAKQLNVSKNYVTRMAVENGIAIDSGMAKSHLIHARRVVDETVTGLEGYAMGLRTITNVREIPPAEAAEMARSLGQSIKAIQQLKKQLQEVAREQEKHNPPPAEQDSGDRAGEHDGIGSDST